jgi:hypothetical protein
MSYLGNDPNIIGEDDSLRLPDSVLAYDIYGFKNGLPLNDEVIFRFITTRVVVFPKNFQNSLFVAEVDATGTPVFLIKHNNIQIGTATFNTSPYGGNIATFSTSTKVTLIVGDRLAIVAPSSQDATLSDLTFILKGTMV